MCASLLPVFYNVHSTGSISSDVVCSIRGARCLNAQGKQSTIDTVLNYRCSGTWTVSLPALPLFVEGLVGSVGSTKVGAGAFCSGILTNWPIGGAA